MENNNTDLEQLPYDPTHEIETVSIESVLSEATVHRDETATADEASPEELSAAGIEVDPELIQPTLPAVSASDTIAGSYDSKKLAETIVDLVDTALTATGPMLYSRMLSPDDRRDMKALALKYRQQKADRINTMVLSERDQEVMEIYVDYTDFEEALPFTKDEKKSLVEPLSQVLKHTKFETTPQTALLIAAGMVALPRAIPLFTLAISKNK
ncbi:hypothetical protein [Edaphocola aurantiacus]|uniref:hypothetical protein n=1 Tax=Edaphocola aurantiacus TaxID=2601682 RepID=UPI001C957EF9|nr:hypothetical protein [Edaphocola aurantiacus]